MLNPRVLEELSACNPERWKRAIRSFRCSVLHVGHGMCDIAGSFPNISPLLSVPFSIMSFSWRNNGAGIGGVLTLGSSHPSRFRAHHH